MHTKTRELPRKWERVADGRMELEHEGCTFDARDFGKVEDDGLWRLECVGPNGSDTFTDVPDFATVKRYAAEWFAGTQG